MTHDDQINELRREINRLRSIVRMEKARRLYDFNNFMYFTSNFPYEWVKRCWPDNPHIHEKYQRCIRESIEDLGFVQSGDILNFCFELDSQNREIMMNWIRENYSYNDYEKERLGL